MISLSASRLCAQKHMGFGAEIFIRSTGGLEGVFTRGSKSVAQGVLSSFFVVLGSLGLRSVNPRLTPGPL